MATEKEAVDEKTPVDELEPIDPLEEFQAQKRATQILDRAVVHIIMAKRPEIAAWQIAFALGSTACIGQSMSKVAADFGVSTAWMSKGACRFCVANDLPPSRYMLGPEAQKAYRELRREQERIRKKNEG